ncbi:NADH-quinone oxidoreductase subunit J [Duncaniella freteri]|jgi:NADH-quinone oxidoreductase subunit J|uniref:NADH-quinone oxidoreductase subunit J n=3 Tax=Duncaniella TaxID=2518495 RepID=A0A4Z0V7S3_9BACT|nr:NADH-quinone oxidoreductase subunit J [Duncaniella freteri]MDE7026470.1 NADH-quinone oxidoreductase subunit J [Duncaniella freteri]NBJ05762.1 NADH-quinone oxidoreductase subunit J [Alistipes sp. Z76]NCE67771.1 NADH-quinone oxidoreductase subunit J [Muribaculaceae bacterium M3]TGG39773.1 NADH-quinone oxidoreductase subunit J [Duncaniella freteri]
MESVGSTISYWIIAVAIVVFSVLTVTTRKILRAATYLLFTLFATAALYFKLDYEFLGAVQIAVYAGGIVVLFVFSILLTTRPGDNTAQLESRKRALGLVGAIAAAGACGWALCSRCADMFTSVPDMSNPTMQEVGTAMLGTGHGQYLLPFEAVSVLLLACIIGGVVVARKR